MVIFQRLTFRGNDRIELAPRALSANALIRRFFLGNGSAAAQTIFRNRYGVPQLGLFAMYDLSKHRCSPVGTTPKAVWRAFSLPVAPVRFFSFVLRRSRRMANICGFRRRFRRSGKSARRRRLESGASFHPSLPAGSCRRADGDTRFPRGLLYLRKRRFLHRCRREDQKTW